MQLAGRDAARVGRRAVGDLTAGADDETRASAVLVTSELVTNAIQAASSCTASAWFEPDAGAIRIEVEDASPEMPVLRDDDDERVGGFGLRIVAQLTTRWGVTVHEASKTVWAELLTPRAGRAEH